MTVGAFEERLGRLEEAAAGLARMVFYSADQPRDANGRFGRGDAPESDRQWAQRGDYVKGRLNSATKAGKEMNPYTPKNVGLRSQYVAEETRKAADVPRERQAVILGGLPGSGKTTALTKVGDEVGIGRGTHATVNSDDAKQWLMERGAGPKVGGLSPMETAPLTHEMSSRMAKDALDAHIRAGTNIIFDGTMNSGKSVDAIVQKLHDAGYTIRGAFSNVHPDTSTQRAEGRYRNAQSSWHGGEGLGGRYVPKSFQDSNRAYGAEKKAGYLSHNEANFDRLMADPRISGGIKADNNGREPVVTARYGDVQ